MVLMQTPAWQAEYARRAGRGGMDIVGAGGGVCTGWECRCSSDGRRNATALAGNAATAEGGHDAPLGALRGHLAPLRRS
ncbi:MAG: hypothetical protein WKG07_35875 [Hymenobacter sp.]